MDLRFNYNTLRDQIDNNNSDLIGDDSLFASDIRNEGHGYIDMIEEFERQKEALDKKIFDYRMKLKEWAKKWEV